MFRFLPPPPPGRMRPAPAALPPPAQVSTGHRHGGKAPAPPPPPPAPAAPGSDTGDELCPHPGMETPPGGTGTAPLRCQGVLPIPGSTSGRKLGAPRCPPVSGAGLSMAAAGLSAGAVLTGGTAGTGAAVIPPRCSPVPGLGCYPGVIPASIHPQRPGHTDTQSEGMARPREKLGRASVSLSGTVKGKENKRRALEGSCPALGGGTGVNPALGSGVTLLAVPRLPRGSRSVGRRGRTLDPDWAAQPR